MSWTGMNKTCEEHMKMKEIHEKADREMKKKNGQVPRSESHEEIGKLREEQDELRKIKKAMFKDPVGTSRIAIFHTRAGF